MKAVFWLGIMVLMQTSRLRFYAHHTNLCFRPFCNFLGDFYVYLEINTLVFLKGLVKFMEKENF